MRIAIDLQPLQTESSKRGIGRYANSFVKALLRQYSSEYTEIFLLFNKKDAPCNVVENFILCMKSEKIKFSVIYLPAPANVNYLSTQLDHKFMKGVERLRETFIEALNPDILLITSLFEFDAITSIAPKNRRSYVTSVILYDLILLEDPDTYLKDPQVSNWYYDKISMLKEADLFLCISNHTLKKSVSLLNIDPNSCINISSASDLAEHYQSQSTKPQKSSIDIPKNTVLYVGGFDSRKNIDKLITAFIAQPDSIREAHTLVLAGFISEIDKLKLDKLIQRYNKPYTKILFLGYVDDSTLINLYINCKLFVFPSANEGFGLPPLEAMSFGSAVIVANRASLPEVISNDAAMFDPDNPLEFRDTLTHALTDESFRNKLIEHANQRHHYFSWKNSTHIGHNFIKNNLSLLKKNHVELTKNDFYSNLVIFCTTDRELIEMTKLLTKTINITRNLFSKQTIPQIPKALSMNKSFKDDIPNYDTTTAPYVFSSTLCREQHFHLPLYTYWCKQLQEVPRFKRKQWEFVFICQTLYERGYVHDGLTALGFGVGKEPIVSYFASQGLNVLATDLDFENASNLGWVKTDQHSNNLLYLNELGICAENKFIQNTKFKNVDMNNIPSDIGTYDICWSSCAFEHLGSIRKGLDFVKNSCRLLKPGGIAVHTTEFNLSSNDDTIDNNLSFVIFRKKDIELLSKELKEEGYIVEPIDYTAGEDELEKYVDLPPYIEEPHLRLELGGKYVATSLGIIIRNPA